MEEKTNALLEKLNLTGRYEIVYSINPRSIDKKAKEDLHIFILDTSTGSVVCKKFLEGKEIRK